MRMRVTKRPQEEFDAEITKDNPIRFKRKDTGALIDVKDCFGFPGTPFKKYDLLSVNGEERKQLNDVGLMIV